MKIVKTVAELQQELAAKTSIGFVPTMGALHCGHVSLVERAKKECQTVVVSVFVNPTQFNDPRDLASYPRDLTADAKLLDSAGATILFAPSVDEIYPKSDTSPVKTSNRTLEMLTSVMEGIKRPGHFDGVVQVVGRLFDIVKPNRAYFGEKDFQQLAIIRAMVAQQQRPIEIVGCPIVRQESGLAFSSRNALLSDHQRQVAAQIYKELSNLRQTIEKGENIEKEVLKTTLNINKNEYLCVEYIAVVNAQTLQDYNGDGDLRICAAVHCGGVRLIDNV